jgi:hypothetical protein
MNWRKGFFRIWVILSALWVLMGAWVIYDNPPQYSRSTRYIAADDIDPSAVDHRNREAFNDAVERGMLKEITGPHGHSIFVATLWDEQRQSHAVQKTIAYIDRENSARRTKYYLIGSGALLVPPTLLMLVGLIVVWIGRGFRDTPDRRDGPVRP